MARSYSKTKSRRENKRFFGIPYEILCHPNFVRLSSQANKLLIDIGMQYYGSNNGDLCATWSIMRARGWKSKETLSDALRELEHFQLIVVTQVGGQNKPTLYALSWNVIHKTRRPKVWPSGKVPGTWKIEVKDFVKPSKIRRAARKDKVRKTSQVTPYNVTVLSKGRVSKP